MKYLRFIFKETLPESSSSEEENNTKPPHVTFLYFGKMTEDDGKSQVDISFIKGLCSIIRPFQLVKTKKDMFGPANDIPVSRYDFIHELDHGGGGDNVELIKTIRWKLAAYFHVCEINREEFAPHFSRVCHEKMPHTLTVIGVESNDSTLKILF